MKTLFFIVTVLTATILKAESKYESGMKKALEQYKAAKSAEEMLAASALFERIANAEKDKWLPYYYAAFTNNLSTWMDPTIDKDKTAEKSMTLIEKAEALESNNAELFCLRQMVAVSQMMVDPMTRWQTYGVQAKTALEDAKKADANNPRIYFLEAQSIYNTPEAYGGGKKMAKPLFEKAVSLYEVYVLPSPFHPDWGKEDASKMLAACAE